MRHAPVLGVHVRHESHVSQKGDPVTECKLVAGQGRQGTAPPGEYSPAPHSLQVSGLVLVSNSNPGGHVTQSPVLAVHVAHVEHGAHSSAPEGEWKLTAQGAQESVPPTENSPARHLLQLSGVVLVTYPEPTSHVRQSPVRPEHVAQVGLHKAHGAVPPSEKAPALHKSQVAGATADTSPRPAGQLAHAPEVGTHVAQLDEQEAQAAVPPRVNFPVPHGLQPTGETDVSSSRPAGHVKQLPVLAAQVAQLEEHDPHVPTPPNENVPAVQELHTAGVTLESSPRPAGQLAQAPVVATHVAQVEAHGEQGVAPPRENCPGEHPVHTAGLTLRSYPWPAGHRVQAPVAGEHALQLRGQGEQAVVPPKENVPATHAEHTAGVTEASYPDPAGQLAHAPVAATQELHAVEHAAHVAVPPPVENLPAPHVVHTAGLTLAS